MVGVYVLSIKCTRLHSKKVVALVCLLLFCNEDQLYNYKNKKILSQIIVLAQFYNLTLIAHRTVPYLQPSINTDIGIWLSYQTGGV
jgi:hypothetical protein